MATLVQRILSFAGFEKRDATAYDPSWAALSASTGYPSALSARAAENLSAVLACVAAISTALAYVPALIYRRDGKGDRVEMPDHPLARLIRSGPNDGMTWPDLIEHLFASTLLAGNGIATIDRDASGQVEKMSYVPWSLISPVPTPSGRLAYDISDGYGHSKRYIQGEVIHLRTRTDDGKIGRSVLSRSAETVSAVYEANTLSGSMLRNGAFPGGLLSADGAISKETAARLKEQWSSGYSGTNAGKIAVAGDGLKWSSIQISPEDAQLLESRKFGVLEICRLFQVPPPLVQDYTFNSFTNAEQAGIWFAMFCLSPWAKKLEAEFARSVFAAGSGIELELDMSGFLRGAPEQRWQTYQIAKSQGILTVDEIRQLEGFAPLPKDQQQLPSRNDA